MAATLWPPRAENVKAAAVAYGADYTELLLIAYPLDGEPRPKRVDRDAPPI
jgi:hypothetical protein